VVLDTASVDDDGRGKPARPTTAMGQSLYREIGRASVC